MWSSCPTIAILDHAGIVGANGAGKSTLFRMLVGQEQPDSGQLKIGETVQTMYVDQSREALLSDRSAKHPVLTFSIFTLLTVVKLIASSTFTCVKNLVGQ